MKKAMIVIGSGALNIIVENNIHEQLRLPMYVILSHKNEALLQRAQQVTAYGGEVLCIVDLQQPLKKLNKKENEQLIGLYEQELKVLSRQHEEFLIVGGAAGLFSAAVLQFLIKLLVKKRKALKVITWLAMPFEGKRFDSQSESVLHCMNRLQVNATIIEPPLSEEPLLVYLEKLNQSIATKIIQAS